MIKCDFKERRHWNSPVVSIIIVELCNWRSSDERLSHAWCFSSLEPICDSRATHVTSGLRWRASRCYKGKQIIDQWAVRTADAQREAVCTLQTLWKHIWNRGRKRNVSNSRKTQMWKQSSSCSVTSTNQSLCTMNQDFRTSLVTNFSRRRTHRSEVIAAIRIGLPLQSLRCWHSQA